jgi:hypothetical protein
MPATERIPIGIYYQNETVPAYEESQPALAAGPLVEQPLDARPRGAYRALLDELLVAPPERR